MRFSKNKYYNALFIILLIITLISLPFTFKRKLTAIINGEPQPPRMIRVIGQKTLDTYFEK